MRTKTGQAATLTDSQLNQLYKRISVGNHAKRNKTIMALSHFLALRAKELAALRVSDVVDTNGNICTVLRLQACYTKGNKHRDLPITNPKLRKILEEWITYRQKTDGVLFNTHAPLFRSQKGLAFSANSMTRMINNLYRDNGFEGCTSHTGRRSAITKLVNKGISLNKVKIIAGHNNIQTTMRYVYTNPDELGEIMKAL
ncbi:MAG: site-specific integrase [Gammaproteobacteria bacterium]|nr:site-specific integrase [Gammaproteobacteria bacterium]